MRYLILALLIGMYGCKEADPPEPIGPLPSERQLAWHELEYYAFIHFNMNTFTNMEWGMGDEPPSRFNPSELDTRQWARVAKEAGMKGIIITAKHHDGFCLWPTRTTEHNISNSPWRDGEGDLVRELSEACQEFGLKFGVYLSPWDRNHAEYGREEYVADYHEQLRELLSNYGEVFEVWFDGANGGSGYYGGANETRKIDNKTYYQWDTVTSIVRELQPEAVIFSDGGPDIRWVGNEEGWADETNWSIMRRDEIHPGWPRYVELRHGHEDGTHWLPAEADVSIRPGWYYHPSEDHRVKSLPELLDIYYRSVGRNASLLLNLPVDTRGLVHEKDVEQLMKLKEQLSKDLAEDLAPNAKVSASNVRGNSSGYGPENLTDGSAQTYWATDDGQHGAEIILEFEEPTDVNRILLQEYIPLGQRVKEFSLEVHRDGQWEEIDRQTTIGYKRILRFETVKAGAIKVNILDAKGPPVLSQISLYNAPALLYPPEIKRSRDGQLSLEVADGSVEAYYTLDGSEPGPQTIKYEGPIALQEPATVRAVAIAKGSGESSEAISREFDISRATWNILEPATVSETEHMIDEDPETFWAPEKDAPVVSEIVIDLGKEYSLNGFTYWPMQERWAFGIFTNYEFYTSTDGKNWRPAAKGEFSNIINNPVEQRVTFDSRPGRFIKLKALNVQGEDPRASFGEIGVLTVSN